MITTFAEGQAEIARRVQQFQTNFKAYHAPDYKEAHARQELIDWLFIALGWDVRNERGAAPHRREVILEASQDVEGQKKAPDYAFRFGADTVFYVEAKKPGVAIKTAAGAAFQLRRYAWSAKLALSLLTDFEELAVYDCRVRPSDQDQASVARINYYTWDQYVEVWRELWDVYSREAVERGSFDQYVQSSKGKRGTTPVDAEFLKEIEGWREVLARNLALRNAALSIDELNDAVQRTIDRIIFLRMAEDRGIEPYARLQELALTPGPPPVGTASTGEGSIYAGLLGLCRQADAKYNSGLFDFSARGDRLTPNLIVDDKVLKPILSSLYFPHPYEFSVMPAEILGNVYEQFLGKVIRLTAGHQAKVEEKPAVKKAGGVYYTPAHIVEYIVKQTVGKAIEGRSPKQLEGFRALDMACGSGSFLLGAYQYLLDYTLQWYVDHNPEKYPKAMHQIKDEWRLTVAEKKRILTAHLFGVDLDRQAVEVTNLSLLLKVLDGESDETLQLKLFDAERALPNLDANIKCGNSLIGPDYFDDQLLLDLHEQRRVNAFDWAAEFPEALKAGGFDCVIGNPPYGAELGESQKVYVQERYRGESKSYDSYELFLLAAARLLKDNGRISMIIPASWLTGEKYEASRRKLATDLFPAIAYAMPFDVFKDAYIDTAIIVLTSADLEDCLIHFFPKKEKLSSIPEGVGTPVPIRNIREDPQHRWSIVLSRFTAPILTRIKNSPATFGEWFEISRGVQPYSRSKHTEEQIASRFLHANSKKSKQYMPELQGNELSRYLVFPERKSFIKYSEEIASTRPLKMFEGKRIVLRRLLTRKFRLQASSATETMITTDNVLNMIPRTTEADVDYALGILNSRLISWVYVNTSAIAQKDDFPQVHISALSTIGLPVPNEVQHDRMVKLVNTLLQLYPHLAAAHTAHDRDLIQRQIDAADQQIDALVYQLYGLTDDEIKIVEGR